MKLCCLSSVKPTFLVGRSSFPGHGVCDRGRHRKVSGVSSLLYFQVDVVSGIKRFFS